MKHNTWFTSDNHFSHRNIIGYTNRPFSNEDEMNEKMIDNWNEVVQPNDDIYHLGDVAFEKDKWKLSAMLRRLNGNKHIIWGNHDRHTKYAILDAGFKDCGNLHFINVPNGPNNASQQIVLCHYAMRTWQESHHGTISLFGHSHGSLPDDPNLLSLDVGVDCWNFYPVSIQQVMERMSKKSWKPIDHHRGKK